MAQCVSIDTFGWSEDKNLKRILKRHRDDMINKNNKKSYNIETLQCIPDGKTYCHYGKDKVVKFSLPCECALS